MLKNSSLYSGYIHEPPKTNWTPAEDIRDRLAEVDFNSDRPFESGGIPVISDGKKGYIDTSDNHVAIFGSSGFKKSLTVYMPLICILAKAGENFFITDPKGELYERTANYLKSLGYKIRVLNLRDHNGECYNPFHYPAKLYAEGKTDKASIALSNIIEVISNEYSGSSGVDPFWPQTAKEYLSGASHLMFDSFPEIDSVNIFNLANCLSNSSANALNMLFEDYPVKNTSITNIVSVTSEPDKTRLCSLATASGFLQPFIQNDKVCREICTSSFELDELAEEKTAFFAITDDTSTAYNKIVTVMISQLQNMLVDKAFHMEGGKLKTRVNFILDEFCSFPVPNICEALATHRSRNIRYFLCIQSIDLLEKVYKNSASILANCATTLFLGSSEMRLLQEISDRCGTTTVNPAEHPLPLVSAPELMTLKKSWNSKELLYLNTAMPARFCTEIPAIEGYKNFSSCGSAVLPVISHPRIKTYGIRDLMNDMESGDAVYPFTGSKPRFYKKSSDENEIIEPRRAQNSRYNRKRKEFLE